MGCVSVFDVVGKGSLGICWCRYGLELVYAPATVIPTQFPFPLVVFRGKSVQQHSDQLDTVCASTSVRASSALVGLKNNRPANRIRIGR